MADNTDKPNFNKDIISTDVTANDNLNNSLSDTTVEEKPEVDVTLKDYSNFKPSVDKKATFFDNSETERWKDLINLSNGRGFESQKLTNALMGFNHRMASNPLPVNREYGGLSFFTRPDFNLTKNNIVRSRKFSNMIAQGPSSVDWAILASLDPCFEFGFNNGVSSGVSRSMLESIPFDNLQGFIPILTHQLVAASGNGDNQIDAWISDEGIRGEQWGMADSTYDLNRAYTMSMTFNNVIGDIIMRKIDVWLEWMSGVKEGKFAPKPINSVTRCMDYFTRFYSIKYDALGNITRFFCNGAMFPLNNNFGSATTVDNSRPQLNDDLTITINWQCFGARYNDPMYMEAFNKTVAIFNNDMIPDPTQEEFVPIGGTNLHKLEIEELPYFNYYGYPHIDSLKRKLTWWIPTVRYNEIRKKVGL